MAKKRKKKNESLTNSNVSKQSSFDDPCYEDNNISCRNMLMIRDVHYIVCKRTKHLPGILGDSLECEWQGELPLEELVYR